MNKRLALLEGKPAGELMVHEIYRSLQGESTWAGLPCVFVRLAVCDARCSWCDTPHAFNQGHAMSLDAVMQEVASHRCPLVELTGGEPLLQPEALTLMQRLCDDGYQVLLETSGAHDVAAVDRRVRVIMDLKCPDSGESHNNRWANLEALPPSSELKLVIASRRDFDWALSVVRERALVERFVVLFSPVFGAVEPRDLATWLLDARIDARMQLQQHKYIWDPNARGV